MTRHSCQNVAVNADHASAVQAYRLGLHFALIAAAAIAAAIAGQSIAAPAAGDTYVYRVTDGYNGEPRGQVSYRVDRADAGRVVMSVVTERSGAKLAATEISSPGGDWLRHSIINRDQAVEYDFAQAYPAYELPLEPGKHWSSRTNAVNPETGKIRSVRIDATVLGTERIQVPAGQFDAIKIKRVIYAGDAEYNLRETTISEINWYVPTLGRSVRIASHSGWADIARGPRNRDVRGDWNIYELVSAPPAR